MGQLELLAAHFALETWALRLRNRPVLLFVDNDSAAASVVKGYSPQTDSTSIVGEFWLLASSLKTQIYIDRAESKQEQYSRWTLQKQFRRVKALGGRWSSPKLGILEKPSSTTWRRNGM